MNCEDKAKITLKGYKNNKRCTKTSENFGTPWNILGFVRQGENKLRSAVNYISPKVFPMPKVDPSTFCIYIHIIICIIKCYLFSQKLFSK